MCRKSNLHCSSLASQYKLQPKLPLEEVTHLHSTETPRLTLKLHPDKPKSCIKVQGLGKEKQLPLEGSHWNIVLMSGLFITLRCTRCFNSSVIKKQTKQNKQTSFIFLTAKMLLLVTMSNMCDDEELECIVKM